MSVRKEIEMTKAMSQRDRTEEDFVAELKTQSTEELGHFLAGSWTASILSSGAIEELYQELRQRKEPLLGGTEEDFVAELETESTEELGHFLAGSWTASILSPEAIEELYQELRQRKEPLLGGTEEDFVAELKTQSTEELGHFLAGSWTASILSPEAIEELYQELHHKEELL